MEIYIEADKLDSMEPPANEPAIRDAFEEAVVQYQGGLGPIDTVYKLGMPVFSSPFGSVSDGHP